MIDWLTPQHLAIVLHQLDHPHGPWPDTPPDEYLTEAATVLTDQPGACTAEQPDDGLGCVRHRPHRVHLSLRNQQITAWLPPSTEEPTDA